MTKDAPPKSGQLNNNEYTAEDIQVLGGRDAVRRRPGMYSGSTDEAMAGCCSRIVVTLLEDDVVKVEDNGRGIPVDIHPVTGMSAVETVMTTLHAGAKFGGKTYQVSGGLHGVGASVVNALSSWLRVNVRRDGQVFQQ